MENIQTPCLVNECLHVQFVGMIDRVASFITMWVSYLNCEYSPADIYPTGHNNGKYCVCSFDCWSHKAFHSMWSESVDHRLDRKDKPMGCLLLSDSLQYHQRTNQRTYCSSHHPHLSSNFDFLTSSPSIRCSEHWTLNAGFSQWLRISREPIIIEFSAIISVWIDHQWSLPLTDSIDGSRGV